MIASCPDSIEHRDFGYDDEEDAPHKAVTRYRTKKTQCEPDGAWPTETLVAGFA
jgi:hypothetical protein